MTPEEYKEGCRKIDEQASLKKRKLGWEYIKESRVIVVGDIIADHIGSIKVESTGWCFNLEGIPESKYNGTCYTKKGEPYKKGDKRTVYEENLL